MPPRPKKLSLPGRCVLTPAGTGRLRASTSESLIPVKVKNVRLPMTGMSPFSFLVLYGFHHWPLAT